MNRHLCFLFLLFFVTGPAALVWPGECRGRCGEWVCVRPLEECDRGRPCHTHQPRHRHLAETKTDDKGYYRFPLVRVGTYRLVTTADGFQKSTVQGIVLSVGQEARLDTSLVIGSTSQTVQVEAGSDILDTGTATVGAVLDRKEIENLPIASRNLYNYLLLAPGVIGMPTSTFSTTQFTFGGTERSQWNLDGLDDTQHGGNRQIRLIIVTPEAVAQTQTLSNGYSAEFGRAAGGQVNVVLKSGTNQFHGSALAQWRPSDLQAIPTLATVQPNRSWYDEAFTLGGPIVKDRLFFFGQFENNPYTLPNAITITPANAAALGLPANEIGTAPFGETYRTLVGKVDYTLNSKNSGYVRYARFTNHQPNNDSGLGIVDRGSGTRTTRTAAESSSPPYSQAHFSTSCALGTIQRDTGNFPVVNSSPAGSVLINISSVANIGFSPLTTTTTTERSTSVLGQPDLDSRTSHHEVRRRVRPRTLRQHLRDCPHLQLQWPCRAERPTCRQLAQSVPQHRCRQDQSCYGTTLHLHLSHHVQR